MKTKIKVCYAGSGVHLTSAFSIICFVLCAALALISVILMAHANGFSYYSTAIIVLISAALFLFLVGIALQALSSIAKTALYHRCILESEYEFEPAASDYQTVEQDTKNTGVEK